LSGGTPAGEIAIDRARERRALTVAQRTATELLEHSQSAFRRGLMPLRDYMEQSALATQIEVQLLNANGARPTSALQQQVDRLRDVRNRLQRFNQPAAEGWAADAALAEWAFANAELDLALTNGDVVAEKEAATRRQAWATEHLRRRRSDANIGAASLPAVSQAESLAVDSSLSDGEWTLRTAEYRLQLERVEARTAEWAERGAGIGRADRLLQAQAAIDLENLVSVTDDGEAVVNSELLQTADTKLRELFDTQAEFHRHGTAELYDLAQTWLAWRNLHQTAAPTPGLLSEKQLGERARALESLQTLADRTQDRRGRMTADVTFVQLLVQLDAADAAQAESGVVRGYLR
jgi:hypothetical protein